MDLSQLQLDTSKKKIWGVCSGIGRWLNQDPVLIRLGFMAFALIFQDWLLTAIFYTLLAIFLKDNPSDTVIENEIDNNVEEITFEPFDEDFL